MTRTASDPHASRHYVFCGLVIEEADSLCTGFGVTEDFVRCSYEILKRTNGMKTAKSL